MYRLFTPLLLVGASFALASQLASAVTIETVLVGNVGNAPDPATGNLYGSVAYAYNIGKTEVTVGQYTEFLNSVAHTDTYALYNAWMSTNLSAGITQSGASPHYSYSVIGSPNKPVTYVSWGDAARFSNWLHNNQPTGPQDSNTTERGAYTLDGAITRAALNAVSRNSDARWFIPSQNEWYKAAFHQLAAQGGDEDNYWAYPTRSNSPPNSDEPPGDPSIQTNVANIYRYDGDLTNGYNDGYAVTDSNNNHLTDVGSYVQSLSSYGTFDQAGNVWEWNEDLIFRDRGMRGGAFYTEGGDSRSTGRYSLEPERETSSVGLRVANVPEPGAVLLLVLGAIGIFGLRSRSIGGRHRAIVTSHISRRRNKKGAELSAPRQQRRGVSRKVWHYAHADSRIRHASCLDRSGCVSADYPLGSGHARSVPQSWRKLSNLP